MGRRGPAWAKFASHSEPAWLGNHARLGSLNACKPELARELRANFPALVGAKIAQREEGPTKVGAAPRTRVAKKTLTLDMYGFEYKARLYTLLLRPYNV